LAQNGKEFYTLPHRYGIGFCRKVDLRKSNIFWVNEADQMCVLDIDPIIKITLTGGHPEPPVLMQEIVAGGVRDFLFDTDGTLIMLRTGGFVEKAHTNVRTQLPDDFSSTKIYGSIAKHNNLILVSRTNRSPSGSFHKQEYFLLDNNLQPLDMRFVDIDWGKSRINKQMMV